MKSAKIQHEQKQSEQKRDEQRQGEQREQRQLDREWREFKDKQFFVGRKQVGQMRAGLIHSPIQSSSNWENVTFPSACCLRYAVLVCGMLSAVFSLLFV